MDACKNFLLRSECSDTDDYSNSSSIFSSGSIVQDEPADSLPECINNNDTSLTDSDVLLTDESSTSISVVYDGTDYVQKVSDLINDDGWDFAAIVDSAKTFEDKISLINATPYQPGLKWNSKGKQPSWTLNYTVLSFLMNGQYYADYASIIGMMGLQVMSQSRWNTIISILGTHVHSLATRSCQQVRDKIITRGEKLSWKASFDGFYLTRGHYSNNSSATLHDISTDKVAWFTHRTKRGVGSNWIGTSNGAEGDMLRSILEDVKANGFKVEQLVMDHDTSGSNVACDVFPEIQITYCGNHSAKTFHKDLVNLKAIPCKVAI